jgi:hypothetical protein
LAVYPAPEIFHALPIFHSSLPKLSGFAPEIANERQNPRRGSFCHP